MTNQQITPLLIVGQSGRFLAQSAALTYDKVLVTDYFGDVDTRHASTHWHLLPDLEVNSISDLQQHISTIYGDKPCHLVYGSGIEYCASLLNILPTHIKVYGNNTSTLDLIQKPANFFRLLYELNLPFPDTQFSRPLNNQSSWLYKPVTGLGGKKIQYANNSQNDQNGYFQRMEKGVAGSALFLANGNQTKIVGINRQWTTASGESPFLLAAIESHFQISQTNFEKLKQAINEITAHTNLRGLNSLDFIISEQQQVKLLEINPRPSASCELYETHQPIVQLHIDACRGKLPKKLLKETNTAATLNYLYASKTVTIPQNMHWDEQCHDLPSSLTTIHPGHPICTLITHATTDDIHLKKQQKLKENIFAQLHKDS